MCPEEKDQTVKGLKGKIYKKQLSSLSLFSLQKRRLREHPTAVYIFLEVGRRGEGANPLSVVPSKTQGK